MITADTNDRTTNDQLPTSTDSPMPTSRMTPVQWLICVIAALGFAFDSYELLMLPLIVRPALADLLGVAPNSLAVNEWVGTMQYVPAVAGGIFGLLGGYLTDLSAGRRVLVWSILLYAFSALVRRLFHHRRTSCSSGAAARSWACASSSWRPWRGWPSSSTIPSSAKR